MRRTIPVLLAAFALPGTLLGQGHAEHLGTVHFPINCSAAAQLQFDHAVALLHNFMYPQDLDAFREVAKADSSCAMAYWGVAMSRRTNPLVGAPDSSALRDGLGAAEQAAAAGAKTQRERDYVAAIEAYYKDWRTLDQRTRVLAYERAMRQLHERYTDDPEAAVFYALALDEAATALPADRTYARQLKAGAILEKVLADNPDHPGALHYLIHTYDFPPLAARGLAAAERYGSAAPAAAHAQHMPSHVYSMLGMWQESIAANRAALEVNKSYVHAMDFMVYAYLQGAQDGEARRVVDRSAAVQAPQAQSTAVSPTGAVLAVHTALAATPARYAIERGAWGEAAALQPRQATPAADAITYFARAMGFARSGDATSARREIDQLDQLQQRLARSGQDYWAQEVAVQRSAASAWVALEEGKREEALRLMRSAADLEDAHEKHIAMENRLWPMRELLGEMLLGVNRPADALEEFEASLRAAPNRYRGLYGAAKAAERSGDRRKARAFFDRLLALCSRADGERPELAEAKAFLARR